MRSLTLTAGTHSLRWGCTSAGPGGSGTGSANQLFGAGSEGSINPKYVVLSVIYAPPGSLSSVDYNSSTLLGTKTSLSNSFSRETSLGSTLTLGLNYKVPAVTDVHDLVLDFKVDVGLTEDFTQTLEGTDSISISKSSSCRYRGARPCGFSVGRLCWY